MTTAPQVLTDVEEIVVDLLGLILGYVTGERAQELLMQAARDQADVAEDVKFGPKAGP